MLTTVAYQAGPGKEPVYALEGSSKSPFLRIDSGITSQFINLQLRLPEVPLSGMH